MRRVVDRMKKNNKKSTFVLQLTAMVDMFTIIIVFLLKSFSTSAVNITPQEGLLLPVSSSYENPVEGVKLVISKKGIFVQDEQVVIFPEEGRLDKKDRDPKDPSFITTLFKALDKEAEKSKQIAEVNEEYKFDGKIVMQADETLPYSLLKKVMYTASMAGYADMKMAVMSMD
tara:strand:- start:32902 stop:33417 length:516 start_codon:yes stop_codon:yes gene_type:complete